MFENLRASRRPLVVIGKGSAYSRAERELAEMCERLGLPVLPTPMGKGVVDDTSDLCVAAARSTYRRRKKRAFARKGFLPTFC